MPPVVLYFKYVAHFVSTISERNLLSWSAYDFRELFEACLADNDHPALQEVLHFVEEGYIGFLLLLVSDVPFDKLL